MAPWMHVTARPRGGLSAPGTKANRVPAGARPSRNRPFPAPRTPEGFTCMSQCTASDVAQANAMIADVIPADAMLALAKWNQGANP